MANLQLNNPIHTEDKIPLKLIQKMTKVNKSEL